MFLLVPAHPGFPGQIPQSRKTVVLCVCVQQNIKFHGRRSVMQIEHTCDRFLYARLESPLCTVDR